MCNDLPISLCGKTNFFYNTLQFIIRKYNCITPCQNLCWCLQQIDYDTIFFHESLAHQNSLFQVFMDTWCHSNFLNTAPHEMSHEKYLSVSCLLSLNQIYTTKVLRNFTYVAIKCVELQVRTF